MTGSTRITGNAAMLVALRDAGHTAAITTDERGEQVVRVFFVDGAQLDVNVFETGDWEYELATADGDGYGGSRDITGQDILDMVAMESANRGGSSGNALDALLAEQNRVVADDPIEMFCEHCAHPMLAHAFFPAKDPHQLGEPAPLCVAEYKSEDSALIDPNCDCEGFVLFPKG